MDSVQSLKSKQGEIKFRKKLELQFTGKVSYYPGQPKKGEYLAILRERINYTRKKIASLQKKGITLAPFLEIGAERGQRSMLLVNEFGAEGFATDLSYDSLKSAEKLVGPLKLKKIPVRVCCDVYNLPFRSKSIPFIFCFQTLHHFPDPKPVLLEIKRVLLPGGYFYFDEEPIAQILNLNLWRRDYHLRWWEKILKFTLLLPFLSTIGRSETKEGVLEKTFDLKTWERALNLFPKVEVSLKPYPMGPGKTIFRGKKRAWLKPPFLVGSFIQSLGGGIEALCQIDGQPRPPERDIFKLLACPNCIKKPGLEFGNTKEQLFCRVCKRTYESKNGIFFLLTENQKRILYPKYSILQL